MEIEIQDDQLTPEEEARYTKEVKHVRRMFFLDPNKRIPGTNLCINRKPYPYIYDSVITNFELRRRRAEFIKKGKMRALERGYQTQDVSGIGNESLYRAICRGLKGSEDGYRDIYRIGMLQMSLTGLPSDYGLTRSSFDQYLLDQDESGLHIVNPNHVLTAFADVMDVKLVLFNAVGSDWIGQQFAPPRAFTEIVSTAYAVCFPNVKSISSVADALAFAAEPVLTPVLKDHLPNQSIDELIRADRIWRQNTLPESSFSPPVGMEKRIKRIRAKSFIVDFKSLYKDKTEDNVHWEPPPSGI